MKRLLYILNTLIAMLFFVSCEDESAVMTSDDQQCHTILISVPNPADTRATYKESGENIAVVWEKGDVIKIGSNEFVFKEMQGTNGLFFHYGDLAGDKTKATFGSSVDGSAIQTQTKNNHCREVLEGTVPGDYNFAVNAAKDPIPLYPAQNMSLLHIQSKSPAMLLGESMLKISGLDKDYTVKLGRDHSLVFADQGDSLNIYVVVPAEKSISGTLKFYFYAYDEIRSNAEDGDEYHYYMKCNGAITTKNNEVVKMPLPIKPTHVAIQLGLPSGMKWATTNIGATDRSETGTYFAWGETEPAKGGNYSPANCKTYNMNWADLYNNGFITKDDKTGILVPKYDAATQNWGDDWKMPTKKEYEELINPTYCSYEMVKYGERYGFEFTSKKNGKKIFFPNGGQWEGLKDCTTIEAWQNYDGNKKVTDYCRGQYWVSNVVEKNSRDRGTAFTSVKSSNGTFTDEPNFQDQQRHYGRLVRPVRSAK